MRPSILCLALPPLLAACGVDEPVAPIGDGPALACRFDVPSATPATGMSPAHRATPIEISWAGAIDRLAVEVTADGLMVPGEVLQGSSKALFVPHRLYPENSRIAWRAAACGKSLDGWFGVGALAHPVVDVEGAVGGAAFEVDLRQARIEAPNANDPLAEVLLRMHLAPALLAAFTRIDEGEATVVLAPAVADERGAVHQDMSRPMTLAKVSLEQNPYVFLPRMDLELALGTGAVELKRADLILGLSAHSLADGRLVADLDLRKASFADGEDPCALVARLTDERCRPCDDGAPACVPLVMHDVIGLPAVDALDPPFLGDGPLP